MQQGDKFQALNLSRQGVMVVLGKVLNIIRIANKWDLLMEQTQGGKVISNQR